MPTQVLEGQSASAGYYLSNIVQISAGDGHAVALRTDGSVYGWGDNSYGQLGVGLDYTLEEEQSEGDVLGGTFTYRVPVRILAGAYATAEKAGEFENYRNHAPITYMNNVLSISAGSNHTLLLLSDGTVWSFGVDTYVQLGS